MGTLVYCHLVKPIVHVQPPYYKACISYRFTFKYKLYSLSVSPKRKKKSGHINVNSYKKVHPTDQCDKPSYIGILDIAYWHFGPMTETLFMVHDHDIIRENNNN